MPSLNTDYARHVLYSSVAECVYTNDAVSKEMTCVLRDTAETGSGVAHA
jgi:hypothetical protein